MRFIKTKTKKAKIIFAVVVGLVVVLAGVGISYAVHKPEPHQDATTTAISSESVQQEATQSTEAAEEKPAEKAATSPAPSTPAPETPASQWPVQLSTAEASSLTAVVNKKHKLPSTYVPALSSVGGGQLRTETASAFNTLLAAAKSDGAPGMKFVSGYRSYAKQEQLYNNYVASDGRAAADTYSARPGFSEHQTGLAVDIGEGGSCDLETCFENTASGKWAAANAYKYGFVVRYPKGKEASTGYQYEPWHLRYLGIAEATAVYTSGKTLEEYYGIPGGGYE